MRIECFGVLSNAIFSNDGGCFVIAIATAIANPNAIAIAYASVSWSGNRKSFSLVSFLSLLSLSTPTASAVISTYTIHSSTITVYSNAIH